MATRNTNTAETAVTSYVSGDGGYSSCFDGNTWQLIGWRLLAGLLITVTLGIGTPWAVCMLQRWETKHTVISGRRLKFTGKGIQLLGKYLLWSLLTLITCGIFGIWFGLKMKQWVVKHTVYEDDPNPVESYFSGGAGGYLGIRLLAGLITGITLGIGAAWGEKKIMQWEAKHTHIGGSPLEFNGTGGQLFGKYLLFILLTPLTLGIYALFFPVIMLKWEYSHTDAVYRTNPIRSQARAHESVALQDCNRFLMAANNAEMAVFRSGITGEETAAELEAKAAKGNPYAKFRLFLQMPQTDPRSAEYLQAAANVGYGPAQYELALRTRDLQRMIAAAQAGYPAAAWWLKNYYESIGELQTAAYWFMIALEWQEPNAIAERKQYPALLTRIALALSEKYAPQKKKSSAAPIIIGVIVGIMVLGGIAAGVLMYLQPKQVEKPDFLDRGEVVVDQTTPVQPSPSTQPTVEQVPTQEWIPVDPAADELVNTWVKAYRVGAEIWVETLSLKQDGSLEWHSASYQHASYTGFAGETGWYATPMGNPVSWGGYTADVENGTLTITVMGDDISSYPSPIVQTWAITYVDSGMLILNNSVPYYPNMGYDFQTLCQMCEVDMSVPSGN